MKKIAFLSLLISSLGSVVPSASALELSHLSTVKLGAFDAGAAEMLSYDAATKQIFTINSEEKNIAVIDLADPVSAKLSNTLDISEYGNAPNCIDTNGTLVAVAIEAKDKQAKGKVAFFTTAGEFGGVVDAGALPDSVIFTPDGNYCLAANEGEPSDDYKTDPEGSVTILDVSDGTVGAVTQVSFAELERTEGVRIFGPGATPAQDLEPEFIACSADSTTAWVMCQENNAVVTVDIATGKAVSIKALGTKDHSIEGNGFDASNKSDAVEIKTWPVKGLYLPDGIASFEVSGKTYIATANEGDAREYIVELESGEEEEAFSEEIRVKDLALDPTAFPNAEELQDSAALGRLKSTTTLGDTDGDGDFDEIYSYGARSFSIWDDQWNLVFDSGDQFEQVTAKALGEGFNSNNDEADSFKNRSDDKGPEPEAVVIGEVKGKTYAFICLERVGGIMVYDVSVPAEAAFVTYHNHRDFTADIESLEAGDLAPEDIAFIPAADSGNGKPLIAVANEVSGTVSVFVIE